MAEKHTGAEILSLLQDAGLTENEAVVYRFLVENGAATTKDLLRKLRFRQPQVYDITTALERKHFLNVLETRPKKFIPESIEAILDQRLKDLKDNREVLLKWAATGNGDGTKQPAMWMSRNWESFLNNTASVILKSKRSLCMEATPGIVGEFQSAIAERDGGDMDSVLMVYGVERRKYESEFLKRDRKLFGEIRYVKPGQFFAVIGGLGAATFMPRAVTLRPVQERYGYVFKDSDVSWFLTHSFFTAWYKAERIYRSRPKFPKRYALQRLAVSDLLILGEEGREGITATVGGSFRKGGQKVELSGTVTGVVANDDVVNFTIESEGKRYVVGGYDAIMEDVVADWIVIGQE